LNDFFSVIWVDEQNVDAVIAHLSDMLDFVPHPFIHYKEDYSRLPFVTIRIGVPRNPYSARI
jgi:hypothetical protein